MAERACPLHRIEIQYFFTLHKTRRISSFLRSRENERKGRLIYDVLNHLVISYSANMHVVHLFSARYGRSLEVIDFGLSLAAISGVRPSRCAIFAANWLPQDRRRLVSLQSKINEKWMLDVAVHFFALLPLIQSHRPRFFKRNCSRLRTGR